MSTSSTPTVIGHVPGHVPSDVAGDIVDRGHVRSRRWFLTGFAGANALDFYMATCAAQGLILPTSFEGNTRTLFERIMAHGVNTYFRNWHVVMCPEQAPTTHTWHVHGAIIAEQPITRKAIKDVFGPWDMRIMRGNPLQALNYIIKSGSIVVYVGDANKWQAPHPAPQARLNPIDWEHVLQCCNSVRSFAQFKRQYIDQGDQDCVRAAISRINFIKEIIAANSPPKRTCRVLLTLWQRALVTLCSTNPVGSHRRIHWIWSTESGTGKSTITDVLIEHGLRVFVWPNASSIKDAIYMYDEQPVIIFDIPREASVEQMYSTLETVSDQTLVSAGKYTGVVKRFFAHVIVLSNMAPEESRLPGRFEIINVKPLADETYELVDITSQLSFD